MIKSKQLSLIDVYADCLEYFENDKPKFLSIDALIPLSFKTHFKKHTGRPREYPLTAFIFRESPFSYFNQSSV